jgi:DNA-binding beta-propeller fold protein YncE
VDGLFRQPTDVAWDSHGNIYITDGYVNSRVAKIDKNGDWVKSWGSKGTGPGQFNLPHSIAIDLQDNIYVGDRSNRRIQVFDTDGNFKRMFSIDVPPDPASRAVNGATPTGDRLKQVIGAPNSICITPGPNQVLFVGESTYPGRIFKLTLDGKVLGVIGRSGRNLGQFSGAHALACPSEHEIYAAETSNWRVQNSCSTERPHRSMTHPFLPTRDTATADRNGAFVHNADVKRVPREDSPKPGKAAEWQAIAARRVWPDIKQYR